MKRAATKAPSHGEILVAMLEAQRFLARAAGDMSSAPDPCLRIVTAYDAARPHLAVLRRALGSS